MAKYEVLDLFSGAGGFSLGFSWNQAFKVGLSIDNNAKLAETYVKNFSDVEHLNRDILSFSEKEIERIAQKHHFDVIIGGPPCQGFSIAGRIGREELEDERNNLFVGYLKFVKVIRPRIFVMENVARLFTHSRGYTFKDIVNAFEDLGYHIKYKIVDTSNYEIAQVRRRILVVGTLQENSFEFPIPSDKKITIREVIDDLPPLESGESSNIPNHIAMRHSKQMLEKMSYVSDGGNREEIPEALRPKSGDIRKYIRYDSNAPSICITGDMRKVFHYSQNRALTNRELARIQSFPDSYIFYGNSIVIQQQIGNAVPPKLAYQIANQVEEFLDA